jgi:hypothetical protein
VVRSFVFMLSLSLVLCFEPPLRTRQLNHRHPAEVNVTMVKFRSRIWQPDDSAVTGLENVRETG